MPLRRLIALLLPLALLAAAPSGGHAQLAPLIGGIALGWAISGGLLAFRPWLGILAASLMGAGAGAYLGRQHVAATGSSICSVNEIFNCDAVNQSKFAEVLGFPTAFIGMAFYLGVALLAIVVLVRPAAAPRAGHAVLGFGLLSVVYSVVLFGVSMSLGTWCLFCISMYGVNILLAVGGYLASRKDEGALLPTTVKALLFQDKSPATSILATTFVLVLLATKALSTSASPDLAGSAPDPTKPEDISKLFTPSPQAVPIEGHEPLMGNPNATFTVVEFADFQCPYCSKIAPEMHDLVEANPDVRLMFKHYPISNVCNANVSHPGHENACGAAKATECARQQGRFWELGRLLFMNQDSLDEEGILFMAEQASLDVEALKTCIASPDALNAIQRDVQAAATVQVDGTPSIYLNDGKSWVKIVGGPEALAAVITAKRSGTL